MRSPPPRLIGISAMVAPFVLAARSLFGIRSDTEEPRGSVIDHLAAVEIREYGPRLAAETTVSGSGDSARSQGFRRLAAYIFGANLGGGKIAMTAPVVQTPEPEKIAMTAPVAQTSDGAGRWTIRFFMPSAYTAQTLPRPTDPEIRIVAVPNETYAVLRFAGNRTQARVAAEQARLLDLLAPSRWRIEGPPTAWFFDPPWTLPFLRRNEVAVRVGSQP